MQITLYSGFSKRLNSLKVPTSGTDKNVVLKNPTSEMRPVFILTGYNLAWNYIKWGASYYYVDDIIILNKEQAEYHCEKDIFVRPEKVWNRSSDTMFLPHTYEPETGAFRPILDGVKSSRFYQALRRCRDRRTDPSGSAL